MTPTAALSMFCLQLSFWRKQAIHSCSSEYKPKQPAARWTAETERANLIKNLAGDLGKVKDKQVQLQMISYFYRANAEYGARLAQALGVSLDAVKGLATARAE